MKALITKFRYLNFRLGTTRGIEEFNPIYALERSLQMLRGRWRGEESGGEKKDNLCGYYNYPDKKILRHE